MDGIIFIILRQNGRGIASMDIYKVLHSGAFCTEDAEIYLPAKGSSIGIYDVG